jgi:hypothetical protein
MIPDDTKVVGASTGDDLVQGRDPASIRAHVLGHQKNMRKTIETRRKQPVQLVERKLIKRKKVQTQVKKIIRTEVQTTSKKISVTENEVGAEVEARPDTGIVVKIVIVGPEVNMTMAIVFLTRTFCNHLRLGGGPPIGLVA